MTNQVYYQQGGGDEQYTPNDREDSQFVKVLKENGFKVEYSYLDYGQDFLNYEPERWDIIISNGIIVTYPAFKR